jgi:hypothetical protein
MKKARAVYCVLVGIIIFLICLDLVNYRELKSLNTKNDLISMEKQRKFDEDKQLESEKNKESKRKFGYSDILSFSSSSDGMKIISIENGEGERSSTKVCFQYKGNNDGFLDMLRSLQKQENLIGVSNIKITHNKEDDAISGSINATFINNK